MPVHNEKVLQPAGRF